MSTVLSPRKLRRLPSKAQRQELKREPTHGISASLRSLLGLTQVIYPCPRNDSFYGLNDPPASFSDKPLGAVLRTRAIELNYFPGMPADVTAHQIAYVTSDEFKVKQVTVTTVLVPKGASMDRIVCQLAKTDGASPACRTSYGLRKGTDSRFSSLSESIFVAPMLRKGWIVNIPDYQGMHDAFASGPMAARATLDSVRAIFSSPEHAKVARNAKIVVWGFSAGAQASFWTANVLGAYAPELEPQFLGFAGGGCPADLTACANKIDDTFAAGLLIGIITGLGNAYPELAAWTRDHLTSKGKKLFEAGQRCWSSYMLAGFRKHILSGPPSGYFTVEAPLSATPVAKVLDEMFLKVRDGYPAPKAPMLIVSSDHDEVVSPEQIDIVVADWTKHGCVVEHLEDNKWGHVGLCFVSFPYTLQWLEDRLNSVEVGIKKGEPKKHRSDDIAGLFDLTDEQKRGEMSPEHLKRIRLAAQALDGESWFDLPHTNPHPKVSRINAKLSKITSP